MRWSRTIRSRVVVSTLAIVLAGIGAAAAVAAHMLGAAAEAGVRRDIERAAGLVAQAGFLRSPDFLERVARFLGAEIATQAPDGAIVASTLRGPAVYDLENLLIALPAPAAGAALVYEGALAGAPVTLGIAADVALVYPGHLVAGARRSARAPLAGLALACAAAATGASLLVARSVVRPIEDLARRAARIAAGDLETRLAVRTGDEVEALSRALETMVAGLREAQARLDRAEKLAALGRLTAALAHELRNPLTSIGMALEIESERLPPGRSRESLRIVLNEVQKLSLFAAKLLAFARGPKIAPRPAPLPALVEEVLALLGPQLEHVGVRVERAFAPGLAEALIDPEALRHVVLNLVQNAADAMPGGGAITIAARPDGARLRLEVADEGVGVAPEDAPRLFEPFFTRKEGGTGLGLAIARAIVEAHGGAIRFRPRAPRGTVFEVELPAVSEGDGRVTEKMANTNGTGWRGKSGIDTRRGEAKNTAVSADVEERQGEPS